MFGDPARVHVLEHAGVENAALAVVAIPESNRAWLAVGNIRRLNPSVPIIARIERESDRERLLKAGATFTVQPEAEASVAMILGALDYLRVSPEEYVRYLKSFRRALPMLQQRGAGDDLPVVSTVRIGPESEVAGRSLKESRIRERFGVSVLGIDGEGSEALNPSPDAVIAPGAVLRVIGHPKQVADFRAAVRQ
jgi:Trk K+ transport system NAD-binding subunit